MFSLDPMTTSRITRLWVTVALVVAAVVSALADPSQDGSSEGNAIMLSERTLEKCVDAEYAYIHAHFRDVSLDGFEHGTIVGKQGNWYDVFRFSTKGGKKHELYFDSTRCHK